MDKKRSGKKTLILYGILIILLLAAASGVREYLQQQEDRMAGTGEDGYALNVGENNKILKQFKKEFPDQTVLLACQEDITDDGRMDLVVISENKSEVTTIVMLDNGDGTYTSTEPIPAPKENQKIRFFDMDKVEPLEVLITGEKDGQVGYAVYRIIDGRLVDLYGDGMKDCC